MRESWPRCTALIRHVAPAASHTGGDAQMKGGTEGAAGHNFRRHTHTPPLNHPAATISLRFLVSIGSNPALQLDKQPREKFKCLGEITLPVFRDVCSFRANGAHALLVGEVKVAVVGEEELEDVGVALAHGPQHRGGPCVVLRGPQMR